MAKFPETCDSLIQRVKDPADAAAWEEFTKMYRPIIYRVARTRGLQEADAQDLAQQVLLAVSGAVGRWERRDDDSRFRNWISRITSRAVMKSLSRGPRDPAVGGTDVLILLEELPQTDPATAELMELEYRRQLYLKAAERVRDDVTADSWQVFVMTAIDGVSIDEAARQLQRSVGSVYAVRSRVMRRLREAVRMLEGLEQ